MMVGLSQLWKAGEQGRQRAVICTAKLTSVAGFEMGSNVGIHTRPVISLEKVLFGLIDAIVPNELVSMGISKGSLHQ
jgi:hypothetical protein